MNYLSHYFADSISGDPAFNFGLAVPDFASVVHKGWKPPKTIPAGHDFSERVFEGIRNHLIADSHFHSSEFFKSNTLLIRKELENHGFSNSGTRLFFAAHLMLEMLLDRVILKNHLAVPSNFYTDLDAIEHSEVNIFFEQSRPLDYARFERFFNAFREHRYLYTYAEDGQLLFALNRVVGRTGQPGFSDSALRNFSAVVTLSEQAIGSVYLDYFEDLKQAVK